MHSRALAVGTTLDLRWALPPQLLAQRGQQIDIKMDRDTARRLARIEGKINIGLKTLSWIAAFVCGTGVFLLVRADGRYSVWATPIGFAAGLLASGLLEWRVRSLEKFLPSFEDSD